MFLGWKNYSLWRCGRFVKTPATPFIGSLRYEVPHIRYYNTHSRQSFLLSYCTKINQYLIVKSKCTLFLQSSNQYLVQSRRKQTTYSYLLIRQPLDHLRDALFPGLICYLAYILLAQCWGIGSCYLDALRGFGVSVVGF